jgi:N,N'-diacetyllegionaminate synthase
MNTLKELGIHTKSNVFIIAEIGLNHGGSLATAKALIDSAVRAGVDAVKFQTYVTEKRVARDSPLFDILKQCELPFESFKELKSYSENQNIIFFSTPFDEESVDYLESINVKLYKIASFDILNKFLLRKIAKTGKTVIVSVGMSNLDEINQMISVFKEYNNNKIALLHCISAYPTMEYEANLAAIHSLKKSFPDLIIGQSDHTNGIEVPIYAVAAGAKIIEKHYKINDEMDCIDAPVSISESNFSQLVKSIRKLELILGNGEIQSTPPQKSTEQYRRIKS